MSTEKLSRESIQEIINRMMIAFSVDSEQKVAEILGYKKDALSVRKNRGTLPLEKIRLSCVDRGINYEWVISGVGEIYLRLKAIGFSDEELDLLDVLRNNSEIKSVVQMMRNMDGDTKKGIQRGVQKEEQFLELIKDRQGKDAV